MMIKSIKIQLKPNNKQKTKLFECAGVARWAYNWTLARQQENYKNGGVSWLGNRSEERRVGKEC